MQKILQPLSNNQLQDMEIYPTALLFAQEVYF